MNYTHYSRKKIYEDSYKKYRRTIGIVQSVSKKDNTIKVKADMDIYTTDNYEKNICFFVKLMLI